MRLNQRSTRDVYAISAAAATAAARTLAEAGAERVGNRAWLMLGLSTTAVIARSGRFVVDIWGGVDISIGDCASETELSGDGSNAGRARYPPLCLRRARTTHILAYGVARLACISDVPI